MEQVRLGVEACTNSDTPGGRTDCYATLCAPGYRCAESILRAATTIGGPVLAVTVLDDMMTVHADFGIFSDGHELAHVIGRQLAKDYGYSGETFMRCPRDYYYGCQHGFFEIVLANSDSPVDAAQSVCESAPPDQRFFCYHGVGHGFMMSYAYDLDDVIARCDELPTTDFKRQACWQGMFMENINSFLRNEQRDGVFDAKDPLLPCSRLGLEYQWECYYNHASYLLRMHDHDVAKAAAECLAADPSTRPACTRGIGQLVGNLGWQKIILGDALFDEAKVVERGVEMCETFPADERKNCVTGMIENLLNYDQEVDAMRTCSLLADFDGQRTACYSDIGAAMLRPVYFKEKRVKHCPQFPEEYRKFCDPDGTLMNPPPPENIFVRIFRGIGDFFGGLWRMVTNLFSVSQSVPLSGMDSSEPNPSEILPPPTPTSGAIESVEGAVIRFDGQEFSPEEVTIAAGESVTWINDSEDPMWPASNDHPTHQVYDQGAFDPQKGVLSGESWTFTFDEPGDWEFHDHLYPTAGGVVHVE